MSLLAPASPRDRQPVRARAQVRQIARGEVHVWRAELDELPGAPADLLDAGERARAAAIVGGQVRARWARGRGLLRTLLGEYLGEDPRALRLAAGAGGKPALAGVDAGLLWFNLSHSGATALYAFSLDGPVGVDVQGPPLPGTDVVRVARRALGSAAARRLASIESREREFLRLWVRHEAALKCRGGGIGTDCEPAHEAPVHISELDLGAPLAGALARAGVAAPVALVLSRWPPG